MKWLSNILKGNRAQAEHLCLKLEEIEPWLNQHEDLSGFAGRLDGIYSQMEKAAADLSRDISDLNCAQPEASTPPKLLRAGLAARFEVAKQLSSLCDKLEPPRKRDHEIAFQHHWAALKGLERTATTFARAQRYVAAIFPKNIERINSDLTEISRLLVDLEQEIGKKRKLSEEGWYIRDLVGRLQEELPRLRDLDARVLQDEARRKDLGSGLASLEEEARRHARSDEGRRAEELKQSLARAVAKKENVETSMAELVAPLSKALSRMAKQGSSSRISLEHDGVFQQLLRSPETVIDDEISGSLLELKSHLSHLGLKDRKKEKTLDHIETLIEGRLLQAAKADLAALDREIMVSRESIAECSREDLRIREEMSQAKKSLKILETGLESEKKELAAGQEKAAANEKELMERLARMAGCPVELDQSREG